MLIFSIVGVIIALLEVAFAIYKYVKETKRRRCSETINTYNKIFRDTYELREKYYNITNENLFNSQKIHQNEELCKLTMNHLTYLESFAKGLEYEVYDFKTFVYLTPNELFEILNSLKQFVYDERNSKSYPLLFNDFIRLTDVMSLCIQKKLNGQVKWGRYTKLRSI